MARGHWKASKNGSDEEFNAETKRAIEAVVNNSGEGGSISVKSIRQVTFSLAEERERFKNLILESKKDIEDKKKLEELEDLYNEANAVISDFYSGPLKWLKLKLRLLDKVFLRQCMKNIEKFNKDRDLLNQRLSDPFLSVKAKFEEILKDMKKKLRKSNKKLMLLSVCRKICGFICVAALIWAAVAAAIPAPPALVVALAAPALPIAALGEFIRPWLKKYEKKVKRKILDKILDETQKRIK